MTPRNLCDELRELLERWRATPDANMKQVLRAQYESLCWRERDNLETVLQHYMLKVR